MKRALSLSLVLVATACSTTETPPATKPNGKNGGQQGYYKVGNPYQVDGVWYSPREDYAYDESGIASWYGPGFHAKYTANGEVYDQNDVTAAHKTLPMPALVRVTNLDNGRTLVVRVNDRGPFVTGRVIDLSRRSAQLLGVEKAGTAKVRVQILAKESQALKDAAMRGQPGGTVVAAAPEPPPSVEPGGRQVERTPLPPQLSEPVVAARPAVDERKVLAEASPHPVAGVTAPDGRFLPAAQVHQVPVQKTAIYIQAGAFSVLDNAERLRQQLGRVAKTDVTPANVGGRQFYRVRIGPIANVDTADRLLAQVIGTGANEAKIVAE